MLRLDRGSYLSAFGSPSPVRGAAGEIGGVEVASQYCSGNKILLPKVRSSQTKVSIATLVKQTKNIVCFLTFCLATGAARHRERDSRVPPRPPPAPPRAGRGGGRTDLTSRDTTQVAANFVDHTTARIPGEFVLTATGRRARELRSPNTRAATPACGMTRGARSAQRRIFDSRAEMRTRDGRYVYTSHATRHTRGVRRHRTRPAPPQGQATHSTDRG